MKMPLYQFSCPQCGCQKEVSLSIAKIGKTRPKCPNYGQLLKRVYAFHSCQNTGATKSLETEPASCPAGTCPLVN